MTRAVGRPWVGPALAAGDLRSAVQQLQASQHAELARLERQLRAARREDDHAKAVANMTHIETKPTTGPTGGGTRG